MSRASYRNANMRGGIGVRKRLEEEGFKPTYRLNGVQTGSIVVRAHDKYRGDFSKGFTAGVIVRRTASVVHVQWHGDDEQTVYQQGDARYEVDRGRWRILGVPRKSPLGGVFDPLAEFQQSVMGALTGSEHDASIGGEGESPPTEAIDSPTEGDTPMADKQPSKAELERQAAKRAVDDGSAKDRDTYTAKQIATRCGTDPKTMRKFFRGSHSTVEPVGQGGRYEFDAADLPKIKREFDEWQKGTTKRREARQTPKPLDEVHTKEEIEEALEDEGDDDELDERGRYPDEPTDEELAELTGLNVEDIQDPDFDDLDLDDEDADDLDLDEEDDD